MRFGTILCVCVAVLAPAPSRAAKSDVYALVGAKVVTVSGPIIENATVIMRDGVIEAVGVKVPIPVDARHIDGRGLIVTPGLIDAFGGVGLPSRRPPSSGTGDSQDAPPVPSSAAGAGSSATNSLQPQAFALERIRLPDALRARDNGVTTALVIGREGVLPGRSALINLSGRKPDEMVLKQPAAMHLHLATARRQYPSALMGTMAYARQSLLNAIHYRNEWAAYDRSPMGKKRPRYDAALAAWQDVLTGKQPLVITANLENDIRRALTLADEFKFRLVVAGAPRAFKVANLVKTRRIPLLVSVNFDPLRPVGSGSSDEEKEKREIEEAERNPAELHKAGVGFALVSAHGPSFLTGVRRAVEKGLPREVALRAVTLEAARVLGVADRTGSIEKGKMANLVAWAGEPLTAKARPKMVFVDGQMYEPPERTERGPTREPGEEEDREEREPPERPTGGAYSDDWEDASYEGEDQGAIDIDDHGHSAEEVRP